MEFMLYTIHDKIAEEYGPPFVGKNDGIAARQARTILKDLPNAMDYDLYKIGLYEADSGDVCGMVHIKIDWTVNKELNTNEQGI